MPSSPRSAASSRFPEYLESMTTLPGPKWCRACSSDPLATAHALSFPAHERCRRARYLLRFGNLSFSAECAVLRAHRVDRPLKEFEPRVNVFSNPGLQKRAPGRKSLQQRLCQSRSSPDLMPTTKD